MVGHRRRNGTALADAKVLTQGGLLGRRVGGVEAHHVADQQRIGQAVRNMEFRAQFVRHRVADAEEGVGEGDAGDGGAVMDFFARHRAFCAIFPQPSSAAPE